MVNPTPQELLNEIRELKSAIEQMMLLLNPEKKNVEIKEPYERFELSGEMLSEIKKQIPNPLLNEYERGILSTCSVQTNVTVKQYNAISTILSKFKNK
jgi:hypothetical protein